MTNNQLRKEINTLKERLHELEKVNELNLKSTALISQNIKMLMVFMKDIGTNQGDIAKQVFVLTEVFNELFTSTGFDKEQYKFFNKDEPWN